MLGAKGSSQVERSEETMLAVRCGGICTEYLYDQQCPQGSRGCQNEHIEPEHKYFDSHCHLDVLLSGKEKLQMSDFHLPPSFAGAITNFVYPILYELSDSILAQDKVYGTVGIHPEYSARCVPEVQELLEELLDHPKVVAVGETGLDSKHLSKTTPAQQEKAYVYQMELAQRKNLPLVFHCRGQFEEMFALAKERVSHDHKIHLHCFVGTLDEASAWMDYFPNLRIGITNLVGRKNSPIKDAVQGIPLECLLLETDAPHFVPSNAKGYHSSHPGLALNVAAAIADLKWESVASVLQATSKNVKFIYRI